MRKLTLSLLAIASLTLAACTSDGKYPYPPQFIGNVPPAAIKPPPKPGSKEYKRQLDMVINTQKHLTEETKAAILAESRITTEMITFPVLGENFTAFRFPATYRLLERAGSDMWRIGDEARDYWNTTRPWLADERVKLYAKPIHVGSYPSGHTLTNHVWARILGDLIPEKRAEFIRRADEIANHRVQGGVHFFFDLTASTLLSDRLYYCSLKKSPTFREAYEAAKMEVVRQGLTHAPELPGVKCRQACSAGTAGSAAAVH